MSGAVYGAVDYCICVGGRSFTVYMQIFEGCNFRGLLKSRIFTVLFKNHFYQPLSSVYVAIVLENFKDLVFVDDKLPTKTAKIVSLENLYVYGNSDATSVVVDFIDNFF